MDTIFLQRYTDAWNAHDIEAIMAMMTSDCLFITGGGSDGSGTVFQGAEIVRPRFEEVWAEFPDVRFENPRHFVDGNRGCSEWVFVATAADGTAVRIEGSDLFEFRDGLISVKNSYIKNRASS